MSTESNLSFLFIHGAGGTKNKWRTLTSLKNDSKFIDLPGHGDNDAHQCETIDDYAKQLADEITEDCIVIGHSMGGLIALELAALNPKVKGIVLVASSYQLPVHPKIIATLEEGMFPDNLFRASYAKGASLKLLEEEQQELASSPTEVAMKDFVACDRYKGGEETLKKLEIPILALLGDEDRLIPPDTSDVLISLNPNVEVVTLQNAGHYVALEQPEAFIKEIMKFKEKTEKSSIM